MLNISDHFLFFVSYLFFRHIGPLRYAWKLRKLSLCSSFFFCSCISVCARYSALQIFREETLRLFTSCFAFMIPSCVCLQMKSEKRKVKREVTGIFNEILSKSLSRYQPRFVNRQKKICFLRRWQIRLLTISRKRKRKSKV